MTKVKTNIKAVAKELAESIGSDNMELYLTADGETGFRQIGSFGANESEVVYKVSLDKVYWRDGFENLGLDYRRYRTNRIELCYRLPQWRRA